MDAEEYGFDTYRSVLTSGTDDGALEAVDELLAEKAAAGGLFRQTESPLQPTDFFGYI